MYESYDYNNRREAGSSKVVDSDARVVSEKKKKKGGAGKFFSSIACGALFGLAALTVVTFGGRMIDKKQESKESAVVTEESTAKDNTEDKSGRIETLKSGNDSDSSDASKISAVDTSSSDMAITDVVEETMPSIVSITTKSVQEVQMMFGMGVQQYEATGMGSGIIIGKNDSELLVVTNNHVVEGSNAVSVSFIDNEVCEASVKGTDSTNDLAVIAVKLDDIKSSTMDAIKIAKLGNSNELKIGQGVIAIGNALGYGQSVTTGIVSALNRSVEIDNEEMSYIQTDAAINPGNSGGALLNMKGEVIGINSAKLASSQIEGMGYAIPISEATPVIEDLMNLATRERVDDEDAGYIGISGISVTSDIAKQYGIPEGVYVSEVDSDGAAKAAGIQKGDVIKKFDGSTVDSISKLRERLDYYKAGETVDVVIARADNGEYKEQTLKVTLAGREGTSLDPNQNNSSKGESGSGSDNDSSNGKGRTYTEEDIFNYFFGNR